MSLWIPTILRQHCALLWLNALPSQEHGEGGKRQRLKNARITSRKLPCGRLFENWFPVDFQFLDVRIQVLLPVASEPGEVSSMYPSGQETIEDDHIGSIDGRINQYH